ncbi:hypothetical protein QW131_07630 [Roseibium salinum]|nr:hypothetical protein [Roseibium salinum]
MTLPENAARIGVPVGAAQSTPAWSRWVFLIGWKRMPNFDVRTPLTGTSIAPDRLTLPPSLTQAKPRFPGAFKT